MLEKLGRLLLGRRKRDGSNHRQPNCSQDEARPAAGAEPKYLLLTRRLPDADQMVPGFRELYYCTTCADYFVLAWHPRSSPLVQQCDVAGEMPSAPGEEDIAFAAVFCPKCNSNYAMYGRIEHPEAPQERPGDALVYESLDYPFPPDVPSHPTGRVKIGGHVVEKIIMLVTGEFPDGLDVRGFAYSGFKEIVLSRHGGDFLVSEQGGIRLHLLRVSTIVDETAWLAPLLGRAAHKEKSAQPGMFLTCGLEKLRAPLGQVLVCLILSND